MFNAQPTGAVISRRWSRMSCHNHQCLWPQLEHRPPTRALQAFRSCSLQLSPGVTHPLCFSVAAPGVSWVASLSLSLWIPGQSLTVIPVISFRRLCPIHLQCLWRISSSAGFCFVRFQSSLLLMVSGHRFQRILLRQVLINVWIFISVAAEVLHVSAPYSRS